MTLQKPKKIIKQCTSCREAKKVFTRLKSHFLTIVGDKAGIVRTVCGVGPTAKRQIKLTGESCTIYCIFRRYIEVKRKMEAQTSKKSVMRSFASASTNISFFTLR